MHEIDPKAYPQNSHSIFNVVGSRYCTGLVDTCTTHASRIDVYTNQTTYSFCNIVIYRERE